MTQTDCKKCKARIAFIKQSNGKWHPVDVTPVRVKPGMSGQWMLEDGTLMKGEDVAQELWAYVSHFGTCRRDGKKARHQERMFNEAAEQDAIESEAAQEMGVDERWYKDRE